MKFEKYILVFLILFLLVILVWNLFNIKKEGFENQDTETYDIPSHALGNYLNCYFYNMGVAFLHGKNFEINPTTNKMLFTQYLPDKVDFDPTIQHAFISAGITDSILQNELDKIDGKCWSSWQIYSKEVETFWTIMKPKVNQLIKQALENAGVEKNIDIPIIHFRCSDSPMNRLEYYHFQKYSYFKDALDLVKQKTGKTYNKLYICYCNKHISNSENKNSCDTYVNSLSNYLETLGYEVSIKCQSENEDFATMFYAPALISTSSSFSFMAGFFSDGIYISSVYDEKNQRECNDCDEFRLN